MPDAGRPPPPGWVGPAPSFDRECLTALEGMVPGVQPPYTAATISALRAQETRADPDDSQLSMGGALRVEERSAAGRDHGIPLLVLTPTAASLETAQLPMLYLIHGGGMIAGSHRSYLLSTLQNLALGDGAIVVSPQYRLAPDHPHPAPVHDCYDGLLWCLERADELGIDTDRVVVGGLSAGAGLAAAISLLARDLDGPAIRAQLLICPMLDDRNDTASAVQLTGLDRWDRTSNETGWTALLGDERAASDVSPYAAPSRATDLGGLPAAFIHAGSAETFRDEAVAYASSIWRCGGNAELHVWPGGFHNFESVAPDSRLGRAAWDTVRGWLARVLEN